MKYISFGMLFTSFFFIFSSYASQNLDANGDGNADILWRNQVTGQNWLWTMNGVVVDESKSLNTIGLHWDIVGRGDFDGDGKSDIFWRNNESGRNYIYLMDGFTIRQATELNYLPYFDWKVRGVTDVNGDGKDDVIWRHQTTGRTWLYTIDGVSIIDSKGLNTVADLNWQIVGTGDINGDGKGDIIWRHKTSGANYIWLMNGTNILDSYVLNTVPTSWHIVGVGDLDGDNTDDIIWRSESGLNWAYLMNDGQIGTSKQINTIANLDWQIRTVGDLNGDGKADIFWRNQSTGKTYAYLMDGTNILSAGYSSVISLNWKIITESTLPTSEPVTPEPEPEPEPEVDEAQVYYSANVSAQIVQSKCILCHTTTGSASSTRLQFEKSTTANYQAINQQRIADFLALDGVDGTYLLTKAQGGLAHGGGSQIVFGSDEYEILSTYLGLVTGGDSGGTSSGDFWEGVGFANNKQTLRRAAIIVAGRLPTDEEYAAVSDNKDASLKAAIRGLMQGDGFHQFLIEGANDWLLTDKFFTEFSSFISRADTHFPTWVNDIYHRLETQEFSEVFEYVRTYNYASLRSPLELIAYVVENDKPYSEILTADYVMVNPPLDFVYQSGLTFDDINDLQDFKPGQIKDYRLEDDTVVAEYDFFVGAYYVTTPGPKVEWPHAGILNDPSFLMRYPSTATNRNRARSRWTQKFFLDFDIETSSARTTEPEALADKDNPTLKNPNCTVCHIPMDPIAGAFQNYGDNGNYRNQKGKNSLPETYRTSENSIFQEGDVWYRDMLEPGFNGEIAPNSENSIQWLAQKIVQDPRFATASVKFWWPAIFGMRAANAPEVSTDVNYDDDLALYQAQSAEISEWSSALRSHWSIKDTLTEMLLSPWFRANRVENTSEENNKLRYVGFERLLTPEQLDRKTAAIIGLSWNEDDSDITGMRHSSLTDEQRTMYGGIDSHGVIKRATEMTSLMSQVALTHASQLSCPAVVLDFALEDAQRKLFKGISKFDVPDLVKKETFIVDAKLAENVKKYSFSSDLSSGEHKLLINNATKYFDASTQTGRDILIEFIKVSDDNGNLVFEIQGSDFAGIGGSAECGEVNGDDWSMSDVCSISIPFEIEESGTYSISVDAYYDFGKDTDLVIPADMLVSIHVGDIMNQLTETGEVLKQKIVELHFKMLGEELTINSVEIQKTYELLVSSWLNKNQRLADGNGYWRDQKSINGENEHCNFDFQRYGYDTSQINYEDDPVGMLTAWRTVLVYLMTDPMYLHE